MPKKIVFIGFIVLLSLCIFGFYNGKNQILSLSQIGSDKDINIFCCADNGNVESTSVTITSILSNISKNEKICIHIIFFKDSPMDENNKEKIKALKKIKDFEIEYIEFNEEILKNFKNEYWNKSIMIKLFASEIFPSLSKILWIDDDLIIREDISKLYKIDLADKYLATVNVADHYKKYSNGGEDNPTDYWLTAGIGLYNLKEIRKDKVFYKFLDAANYYSVDENRKNLKGVLGGIEEYVFTTCVPKDKLYELPITYSIMTFFANADNKKKKEFMEEEKEIIDNGIVYHFSGSVKPWRDKNYAAGFLNTLFFTEWMKYYNMISYLYE